MMFIMNNAHLYNGITINLYIALMLLISTGMELVAVLYRWYSQRLL